MVQVMFYLGYFIMAIPAGRGKIIITTLDIPACIKDVKAYTVPVDLDGMNESDVYKRQHLQRLRTGNGLCQIQAIHEAAGGHSQNRQKDVQHHFLGTQEQ